MSSATRQPGTSLARTIPPESMALAQDASAMWDGKWSTFEKLKPADRERVAAVIHHSFPDLGAFEITKYFDMLGGKLRENAEFWLHVAAHHPATEWGPELEELQPETEGWNEWVDASLGRDVIAAAYVCRVKRRDRTGPVTEGNYVTMADPILYNFTYVDLRAKNREEAQLEAAALVEAGRGRLDRVGYRDGDQGAPRTWWAKFAELAPDWRALAKKKARTTASRRCIIRTYSLSEAKMLLTLNAAQQIIDRATLGPAPRTEAPPVDTRAGFQVSASAAPGRPITDSGPKLAPAPGIQRPEVRSVTTLQDDAAAPEAEAVDPATIITPEDRRKLLVWAHERDLGGDTKTRVKEMLADLRQVEVEQVSTKQMTYGEMFQIRQALEAFPLKPGPAA